MAKLSGDLPVANIKWLKFDDFEFLCFSLARDLLSFNEPIPDFESCDLKLLESALSIPVMTYGQELLYPTIEKQAAALFYSLIKNHPFKNGNKRIAVMSLMVFLFLNNLWLRIDQHKLYELALSVSKSLPEKRDKVLRNLEKTIKISIEKV
jgi:death-on-curing family protein